MALDGADTAALDLYSELTAFDPRYRQARERIVLDIGPEGTMAPHAARITLVTRDGRQLIEQADVGIPSASPSTQWSRLVAKARAIVVPVIGETRFTTLVSAVDGLDGAADLTSLFEVIR